MKIVKLLLSNYKGIENEQIIDFSNQDLFIFDGPNGYGKTTIFDAIELCLRGRVCRTEKNCQVTNDTQDYKKPYFQNKSTSSVVIKCHVKNSKNEDLVIVKFVDADGGASLDGAKKNKVNDWDLIETYQISVDDFYSDFSKEDSKILTREDINKFFFGENSSFDLEKIYLLFNYVQQEENLFFLKQSEYNKKKELSFLFQTEKEEKDFEKIKFLIKNCKERFEDLENQIKDNEKILEMMVSSKYFKIFKNKEYSFDLENPFINCNLENIDSVNSKFQQQLNELDDFVNNFDLLEYSKYRKLNKIRSLRNNDQFLQYFLFKNLLQDKKYKSISDNLLLINKYKGFKVLSFEEKIKELKDLNILAKQDLSAYKEVCHKRTELINLMDENSKILSSLNDLRAEIVENFNKIKDKKIDNKKCPLCGYDWKTVDDLNKNIEARKIFFEKINNEKTTELKKYNQEIKTNFLDKVEKEIDIFLQNKSNVIDEEVYSILTSLKNINFSENESIFSELFNEQNIDIFIIRDNNISLTEFNILLEKLKTFISERESKIEVDSNKIKNLHLFKDYFDEDQSSFKEFAADKIKEKKKYLSYKVYEFKLSKVKELKVRKDKIGDVLNKLEKIKEIYKKSITEYKSEMIKQIKIPFFVYSGRILQNYQQGMGIFIDIKENSNSIRFLTDPTNNDHDAMHQLSSGQLSVISIAFLLSLNKVYNLSGKFLAIDDPVQSLDDINIHSFIELLRHDFGGYQIFLSTHDESSSNYINYKFNKFNFRTTCFNVKDNFYKI